MIHVLNSVAHTWQCDVMGHLTTRFYVGMFDDASYHFLHELFGWNGARDPVNKLGWVDVRHVIEYQTEVTAGDVLAIRAGLDRLGGKSITVNYEMTRRGSDEIAATLQSVMVLFDLEARSGRKIPDELRARAIRFLPGHTR